jgi:hypothetical protein
MQHVGAIPKRALGASRCLFCFGMGPAYQIILSAHTLAIHRFSMRSPHVCAPQVADNNAGKKPCVSKWREICARQLTYKTYK